jgi:hypothetical protein
VRKQKRLLQLRPLRIRGIAEPACMVHSISCQTLDCVTCLNVVIITVLWMSQSCCGRVLSSNTKSCCDPVCNRTCPSCSHHRYT